MHHYLKMISLKVPHIKQREQQIKAAHIDSINRTGSNLSILISYKFLRFLFELFLIPEGHKQLINVPIEFNF